MVTMGSRSATELLQLPVQLHGIRLGRPVDLLLDPVEWRALGFVVLCGDESSRFLVFAAADLREDAIHVSSALVLLDGVDFYRDRSRSLRDLLRGGELLDLLVASDGSAEAVESERVSTA
jgi:hypothetical protein